MSTDPINPWGVEPLTVLPPHRPGWTLVQGVWLNESRIQDYVGRRNGALTVVSQCRKGPANARYTELTLKCDDPCGETLVLKAWDSKRVRCVKCSRKRSSAAMAAGLQCEARRAPESQRRDRLRGAMWKAEHRAPVPVLDKPLRPPVPPSLGEWDEDE